MKVTKLALTIIGISFFSASFAMGVDITISGTIPAVTTITVTTEADIGNLDLTADLTDKKIATVTERSNKRAGYTVTVQSVNAGAGSSLFLKGADGLNTDNVPYTLSYGGTAAAFTGGVATVTDATTKTTKTGYTKDVAISVAGTTMFPNADTYSDTLTFTVTAK